MSGSPAGGAIRVLVVDDERLACQRLARLLQAEPDVRLVGQCTSGPEAVEAILAERPDLLLLDVQMHGMDGFAVLQAVPPAQLPVTIFVTAYDEYAVRAFEARALDYLLKPFTENRFREALARARQTLVGDAAAWRRQALAEVDARAAHRLLVRDSGRTRIVSAANIDYVEAARNQVRLHLGPESVLLREPLSSLERRLDPARFARIHRSSLVNLERVVEIQPLFSGDGLVVLRGGARLRLSRSHRREFERRLGRRSP